MLHGTAITSIRTTTLPSRNPDERAPNALTRPVLDYGQSFLGVTYDYLRMAKAGAPCSRAHPGDSVRTAFELSSGQEKKSTCIYENVLSGREHSTNVPRTGSAANQAAGEGMTQGIITL